MFISIHADFEKNNFREIPVLFKYWVVYNIILIMW